VQAASKHNDKDTKNNQEQPEKAPNDKEDKATGESLDASPNAKAKTSTLTIIVRGGKKPTEQAEVRVTAVSPTSKTGEIRRFTNSKGQIVLSSLEVGTVEILVIAKGWKTNRRQITLKAGNNPLTIDLEPL